MMGPTIFLVRGSRLSTTTIVSRRWAYTWPAQASDGAPGESPLPNRHSTTAMVLRLSGVGVVLAEAATMAMVAMTMVAVVMTRVEGVTVVEVEGAATETVVEEVVTTAVTPMRPMWVTAGLIVGGQLGKRSWWKRLVRCGGKR